MITSLAFAVAGMVAAYWFSSRPVPFVRSRAPALVEVTPRVVAVEDPPAPASAPVPPPDRPILWAGFCAPDGDEGAITIQHTLQGLIQMELRRRMDALPSDDDRSTVMRAGRALDEGNIPATVNVTALLVAAFESKTPERLLPVADQAGREHPDDPDVQVAKARLAEQIGRAELRIETLRRARRALPRDPAIGWSIAQLLRDTPDLDEAIAGLDAYLAADPVPALVRLRARLQVQRDIQHDYRKRQRNGVTLLWAPDSISEDQADAVLAEIDGLLHEASRLTGTALRSRLTVVVYPGREELLAVSCVRNWTGALYDGSLRVVAAQGQPTGVDLQTLRHESLHAAVLPEAPKAPRWFHEGLAQEFANEAPRVQNEWRLMIRNRTWIPFASLDGSFQAFEDGNDAGLAYAQSLALIELVRDLGGEGAIADLVHSFKEGADTETALAHAARRSTVAGDDLLDFLARRLEVDR